MITILPTRYARTRWTDEEAMQWIGESFTWTDRASYLAWVAAWKAELKTRIADIRYQKAIRSDKAQEIATRNGANVERQELRIECANLMMLRRLAKAMSATQRHQRLAA